jgi:hypothetical protein
VSFNDGRRENGGGITDVKKNAATPGVDVFSQERNASRNQASITQCRGKRKSPAEVSFNDGREVKKLWNNGCEEKCSNTGRRCIFTGMKSESQSSLNHTLSDCKRKSPAEVSFNDGREVRKL